MANRPLNYRPDPPTAGVARREFTLFVDGEAQGEAREFAMTDTIVPLGDFDEQGQTLEVRHTDYRRSGKPIRTFTTTLVLPKPEEPDSGEAIKPDEQGGAGTGPAPATGEPASTRAEVPAPASGQTGPAPAGAPAAQAQKAAPAQQAQKQAPLKSEAAPAAAAAPAPARGGTTP
jgi:hypothetical protein